MKIEKTTVEPAYRPVTLTITIESEMEERVLRALGRASVRVPDMLVHGAEHVHDRDIRGNIKAHAQLSEILDKLYTTL